MRGQRTDTASWLLLAARVGSPPPVLSLSVTRMICVSYCGAISKRTNDWLEAHQRRPRSVSPLNELRKRELDELAAQTALLGKNKKEQDVEIAKMLEMKIKGVKEDEHHRRIYRVE